MSVQVLHRTRLDQISHQFTLTVVLTQPYPLIIRCFNNQIIIDIIKKPTQAIYYYYFLFFLFFEFIG